MVTRLYYNTAYAYNNRPTGVPNLDYPLTSYPTPIMQTFALASARPFIAIEYAGGTYSGITSGPTPYRYDPGFLFVSPSLDVQTLSGTVKGQIRMRAMFNFVSDSADLQVLLVDSNFVYKSTLYGGLSSGIGTTLPSTTAANRQMPAGGAKTLTSTLIASGDRLLIRPYERMGSSTYGWWATLGGATAGDLPEDETTTTDNAPWIEFSQNIVFLPTDDIPTFGNSRTVAYESSEVHPTKLTFSQAYTTTMGDPGISSGSGAAVPTTGQTWPRGGRTGS